LHSANVPAKNELQMLIQHRFGDISGGFYDFFGLDYASLRLGFEYGITNDLNLGIGRSNYRKTFDSFIKYRILEQSSSMPLTLTATVAGSFPTIKDDIIPVENSDFLETASGNVQLHIAKSFKSFGFQVSPGYIGTGYFPDENNMYSSYSFFTLGFGGSVKLAKKVTLNIEYLRRFEDEIDNTNPLSASIDLGTSGHLFQIMISNVQQMYDQGIITNPEGGDWTEGHLFLGFNLIRAFNFKQY
ncbi:MAG: DUF5777 family beta-barrel protein, partial [Draconibacterium sp.]|nr:DUF5777 family beta-barrel protein [Draconibacterium sp.]